MIFLKALAGIDPVDRRKSTNEADSPTELINGKKTWKEVINDWKSGNIPEDLPHEGFLKSPSISSTTELASIIYFKDESGELASLKHDYLPFGDKLLGAPEDVKVTEFDNRTKDSKLIVPIPERDKDYTTIYRFMRNSPVETKKAFFKLTAVALEKWLKTKDTVYLNTHGFGVHHLHMRLDPSPKYYKTSHNEYFRKLGRQI